MKCLIVLFAAVAVSSAQYLPFAHLTPGLRTQHHAQNEVGDYSFGYSGGPSSKQESRIAGVTQGSFSYVDAHGLVQSRSYAADPLTGFHVAGTDIPVDANTPVVAPVAPLGVHAPAVVLARRKRQAIYAAPYVHAAPVVHAAYVHPLAAGPADTPEVAIAKLAHYQQYNYEAIRNAHLGRRKRSVYAYAAPVHSAYAVSPALAAHALAAPAVVAAPLAAHSVVAPAVVRAAPLAVAPAHVAVAPAVAPAVSSQYQAQDELGQYSYGYSNPTASKTETRYANGVTQGGYSYVDAHGLVQSASYVSDPVHGFRVAATNLPIA